jgi:hypothetical protein
MVDIAPAAIPLRALSTPPIAAASSRVHPRTGAAQSQRSSSGSDSDRCFSGAKSGTFQAEDCLSRTRWPEWAPGDPYRGMNTD